LKHRHEWSYIVGFYPGIDCPGSVRRPVPDIDEPGSTPYDLEIAARVSRSSVREISRLHGVAVVKASPGDIPQYTCR
jgi:hypothetical protein